MKKILATVLGIICCAATAYAAPERTGLPAGPGPNLAFSTSSVQNDFLTPADERNLLALPEHAPRRTAREEVARWAYKVSYVGSLLLTADHLIRSMDSVMESMEVTREDGTQLRLLMEPKSRGFDVMLRLSRPLGF